MLQILNLCNPWSCIGLVLLTVIVVSTFVSFLDVSCSLCWQVIVEKAEKSDVPNIDKKKYVFFCNSGLFFALLSPGDIGNSTFRSLLNVLCVIRWTTRMKISKMFMKKLQTESKQTGSCLVLSFSELLNINIFLYIQLWREENGTRSRAEWIIALLIALG